MDEDKRKIDIRKEQVSLFEFNIRKGINHFHLEGYVNSLHIKVLNSLIKMSSIS